MEVKLGTVSGSALWWMKGGGNGQGRAPHAGTAAPVRGRAAHLWTLCGPASSDSCCTSLGRTHALPFHEELRCKVGVRGADKSPGSRVRGRSGHPASEASWGGLERSLPSTPACFKRMVTWLVQRTQGSTLSWPQGRRVTWLGKQRGSGAWGRRAGHSRAGTGCRSGI